MGSPYLCKYIFRLVVPCVLGLLCACGGVLGDLYLWNCFGILVRLSLDARSCVQQAKATKLPYSTPPNPKALGEAIRASCFHAETQNNACCVTRTVGLS